MVQEHGKTTIIKCIIDLLEKEKKDYVLAAPTGRAAKRITETTGKTAKTLHRLLEILKVDDKDLDSFIDYEVKGVDKDFIIIDEASMIDTLMMNNIIKSLSRKTKLILVGDVNQLPSVGAGAVLKDIINSGKVPIVFLKHIYRQSMQSDIIINAHKVNNGENLEFKSNDTDLFYINVRSSEEAIKEIQSLVSYRLAGYKKMDVLKDLQVLTPTKKADLGTGNLNKVIQEILNKKAEYSKQSGDRVFKPNDKVMQIINNYDREYDEEGTRGTGIFNGDIGYVTEINNSEEYVKVVFDDIKVSKYKFNELEELEHAYAITIHKSQGSEYDYVIIPLYNGYRKLFTRNLLYTAMTRAKKMLILIGTQKIFNMMIENVEEKNRKTGLEDSINLLFKDNNLA